MAGPIPLRVPVAATMKFLVLSSPADAPNIFDDALLVKAMVVCPCA